MARSALVVVLLALIVPALVCGRRHVEYLERSVVSTVSIPDASLSIASGDRQLPVFFFHGITNNASEGRNYQANLTAEGRIFVALNFCPGKCSTRSLHVQVPLAIKQIRAIVASDARFNDGYIFIAQSQGGIIARSVIEEMDDHRVHTFVSLAGVQNGVFYGPQPADRVPLAVLLRGFGAHVVPPQVFDFAKYANSPTSLRGEMQRDLARLIVADPDLDSQYSFVNLGRFPAYNDWITANRFLPVINNVNRCEAGDDQCLEDKQRRKRNFLKLKAAHFFASPNDGVVAPWQLSHFGRYSQVDTVDEIATAFESLTIVGMHDTDEYVNDTFGLRSLDDRGALFLHEVPGVSHSCWVQDGYRADDPTQFCSFHEVYDRYVYPLLV